MLERRTSLVDTTGPERYCARATRHWRSKHITMTDGDRTNRAILLGCFEATQLFVHAAMHAAQMAGLGYPLAQRQCTDWVLPVPLAFTHILRAGDPLEQG